MSYLYLSCNSYLIVVLITDGTLSLVTIVKGDANGGLGDSGLTMLIDQFLKTSSPHL